MISAIRRLLRPGGIAISFYSKPSFVDHFGLPLSPAAALHYPVRKLFGGGEEKDTFPTQYKMNTRITLRRLFEEHGFREYAFLYLDDVAVFRHLRYLGYLEALVWSFIFSAGIRYPENCLLGLCQRH